MTDSASSSSQPQKSLETQERIYKGKRKIKEDGAVPFGFRVKRDGGATASGKTKEDAVSPEEARIPKHCTLDS